MNTRGISILSQPEIRSRGFTLLEMCLVLFVIALLAGAAMPAMSSAFTDASLRTDAHQVALLVRTAMLECNEQQRPYTIRIEGHQITLEPAATAASADVKTDAPADDALLASGSQRATLANPLKIPDAEKPTAWRITPATWTFEPSALCTIPRVRIERGRAYLEMGFDALTGNVENESTFVP